MDIRFSLNESYRSKIGKFRIVDSFLFVAIFITKNESPQVQPTFAFTN